ncbi:MAG TPA: FHA domain-containing protein [Anaerolineales bacterium]|nr:FHA domain-containing protein [Anaerolineales bacterium]
MNVTENICPVCNESNDLEAVVCGKCGAALEDPFMDPGARTKTTNITAVTSESIEAWSIDHGAVPDHGIAVYLEGEFHPAFRDSRTEFVIGRKAGTTSPVSEVLFDLAPLGGYARGISRRHAVIQRTERGYEILDLGSVNGTWLNDERLAPHKNYPLASGSHLRLGSMRLFVLYHPHKETRQ